MRQQIKRIGAQFIAIQEGQIMREPSGDVSEKRKKRLEAEKQ